MESTLEFRDTDLWILSLSINPLIDALKPMSEKVAVKEKRAVPKYRNGKLSPRVRKDINMMKIVNEVAI
ncbi:hypothetical protein AAHH67_05515 [Niallia circulans]